MDALCLICKRKVEADYSVVDRHVELVRRCRDHDRTSTVVSHDIEYFHRSLESLSSGWRSRGLIVEMLDGCNIECPTCIASSSPELQNHRNSTQIRSHLSALVGREKPCAVFLSGGEPTIHPELDSFISIVEEVDIRRRIVITNGVRIACDSTFAESMKSSMSRPWEVFLQFDSLRPAVLKNIRGANLRSVRLKALEALNYLDIATTLVCVVKRGLNLDELGELVEFARLQPCVVGLQFQPIREAGRLGNYDQSQHSCDLDMVRRELDTQVGTKLLQPHPQSPLSVSIAALDKSTGEWMNEAWVINRSPDFYVEETTLDRSHLRVAVVEYSDVSNWSTLKSTSSPIDVLMTDGSTVGVDDHFLDS